MDPGTRIERMLCTQRRRHELTLCVLVRKGGSDNARSHRATRCAQALEDAKGEDFDAEAPAVEVGGED